MVKVNTSDWRNISIDKWTVRTFHAYFADMNAELYGAAPYLPFRNWSVEQRMIKTAIGEHGAEILRQAFDECFRTYRPSREYPLLTAGFCVAYRINAIIPRLNHMKQVKHAPQIADVAEVKAWL